MQIFKKLISAYIIVLLCIILTNCVSTSSLPESIKIIPPSSDIPSEIAAFSGRWDGILSDGTEIILIVERIDTKKADVIIFYGVMPVDRAFYQYHEAVVLPGPAIQTFDTLGTKKTFKMKKGLKELDVIFEHETTSSWTEGELIRITN